MAGYYIRCLLGQSCKFERITYGIRQRYSIYRVDLNIVIYFVLLGIKKKKSLAVNSK